MRLRAAGINPADYKQRAHGAIGGTLPVVLGSDGAGIVESTGPGVSRFLPGDEVYFCDGGFGTPGTYQEIRIVDERFLARKPRRLSFVEAAAAPLVTTCTVRRFGTGGCAGRMAQEFGDHPDAAAERMRWVCRLAVQASGPGTRPDGQGITEGRVAA